MVLKRLDTASNFDRVIVENHAKGTYSRDKSILFAIPGHDQTVPQEHLLQTEMKAAYKSGEIHDMQEAPITLDKIKLKLKESEVFNWQDPTLTAREKKEMNKLFDAVEIMVSSRNRQPSSVQNMFSSLRLVERAVKKQLKENQISETLAAKFNWEKLSIRQRREKPHFTLDKTTNMRVFNLH